MTIFFSPFFVTGVIIIIRAQDASKYVWFNKKLNAQRTSAVHTDYLIFSLVATEQVRLIQSVFTRVSPS